MCSTPTPTLLQVFIALINTGPLNEQQRAEAQRTFKNVQEMLVQKYNKSFAAVLSHCDDVSKTLLQFMDLKQNGRVCRRVSQ